MRRVARPAAGSWRGTAEITYPECLLHGEHSAKAALPFRVPAPQGPSEGRKSWPCSSEHPESPSGWTISPKGAALVAQFQKPPKIPPSQLTRWLLTARVGLGADGQEARLAGSPSLSSIFCCSVTKWPEWGSSFLLVMGRTCLLFEWVSSSLRPRFPRPCCPQPLPGSSCSGVPVSFRGGHGAWA